VLSCFWAIIVITPSALVSERDAQTSRSVAINYATMSWFVKSKNPTSFALFDARIHDFEN
jgi:hypothetical protein